MAFHITPGQFDYGLGALFQAVFEAKANLTIEVEVATLSGMAQLNADTRGVNQPTDVLSYPLLPDLDTIEALSLPDSELNIGSIVICQQYAQEAQTPLPELVLHGTLHLLGFDHDLDQAEWDRQELRLLVEAAKHKLDLVGLQQWLHSNSKSLPAASNTLDVA